MTDPPACAITLRALEGEPLADPAIHDMVVASARALAERHGIELLDVDTTPTAITLRLRTARIAAIGFAAELRRSTTRWYTRKFGEATLWGEADDDTGWRS